MSAIVRVCCAACAEGSRQLILCLVRPVHRASLFTIVLLLLGAAGSLAADARSLVGVWRSRDAQLTLRSDGTWSAQSQRGDERRGSWHVADDKLVQTDWSGPRESAIVWDILVADREMLKLRFIETDGRPAKRYDMVRIFRRVDTRSAPPKPNQAMQRTASKLATAVQRVCPPRFGCVAGCGGLAVADLVSR